MCNEIDWIVVWMIFGIIAISLVLILILHYLTNNKGE